MSRSTLIHYPPSLIPPSFAWSSAADVFGVRVAISDPNVVEFIATGEHLLPLHRTRKMAIFNANLIGAESLHGQIEAAAWAELRHSKDWIMRLAETKVHCHGTFALPGEHELLVLVGVNAPSVPGTWLTSEVREYAAVLLKEYEAKLVEYDQELERDKQKREELNCLHHDTEKRSGCGEAITAMKRAHQRPILTADRLLPHLPKAAILPIAAIPRVSALERAATKAIANSGWPDARDGTYAVLLGISVGARHLGMITWEPYSGPPPYPEIRWAVQRRMPHALRSPRSDHVGRPKSDTETQLAEYTGTITGFDVAGHGRPEFLEDIQLDQSDFRQRVDDIRRGSVAHGFEAIAWFQPYHSYTDETWGIYFDSRKLDDLALSLLDDFKSQRIHGSHSDAAHLAFGLTYAHELFHAKVEAALSWLEINAQQPRHLRYKQRVYNALRDTPECLEEVLANWSAWNWFQSASVKSIFTRRMPISDNLQMVVEALLDLSPPGYRDWRDGHQPITWRTFAMQLSTGNPNQTPISLPLESTLLGPLPYDIQPADIPFRFVGSGVIADRLQSHPATFNVPARRELEKALKFFKYIVDPAGGKGGHQKWTGPDKRAFILPTRDPVSVGVFKTFLQHLCIDKATYVGEVRPNL